MRPPSAFGGGGAPRKTSPTYQAATGSIRRRSGAGASLHEQRSEAPAPLLRLMEPVAAWYVGDVLRGAPPPPNALGGRIAFKTGTSYGYRDAWAVGYDGKYTIGVWVGRPDGAPVTGLVGRTAAAPIPVSYTHLR